MNRNVASADEALIGVLSDIWTQGTVTSPRGLRTREAQGLSFRLTNPRARRIALPERRWNEALAVGEFCWHASGSKDVSFISYYVRKWGEFSEDGCSIEGSCYGNRIFSVVGNEVSQWDALLALLRRDPATRRAVLVLSDPMSLRTSAAVDVPCISMIQFLVRDGLVHCHNFMRSNDAIWGMCYDIFFVTMLQEMLACELGLEVGDYYHICSSLHVYERHFSLAEAIISRYPAGQMIRHDPMSPMKEVTSLARFLRLEEMLRKGEIVRDSHIAELGRFWQELLTPLMEKNSAKQLKRLNK